MKTTILSIFLLTASPMFARQQTNDAVIDDVIIQENYEVEFNEEKLPVDLALDFAEVVEFTEPVNWDSIDQFYQQSTVNTGEVTLNTLNPQSAQIRPAPVKVFKADFKNIRRWQLDITASDGSVFRTIAGVDNPPQEISWDGLSNEGETLTAGLNYAYSFTAVDKAGNKRTFPGATFTIPAFYLYRDSGLFIAIAADKLFSADGLYLLPESGSLAQEIALMIRCYLQTGKITVSCSHSKTADFLKLLADELIVDAGIFVHTRASGKACDGLSLVVE